MAPAYKLYYFDGRGAAESIRYLFKYGNIEFEDVRVSREEWASKLKAESPFGQVPMLEHNGKKVAQSVSICRYLGHILKIAGKDEWENLEIDSIADSLTDLRQKVVGTINLQDEEQKKAAQKKLVGETVSFYFSRYEALIRKNNGYLAIGRLTWLDILFVAMASSFDRFLGAEFIENYPNIKALVEKVEALPAIKEWIAERPETPF